MDVFEHPKGIVFVTDGWTDPLYSGHPFHLLEGTLEGNGPWWIGDVTLSAMTEEHELWPYWLDYKAEYGDASDLEKRYERHLNKYP